MGLIFVYLVMVAGVAGLVAPAVYVAFNLALAPWLGWPEMPPSVAVLVGVVVGALVCRVRRSRSQVVQTWRIR